MDFFVVPDTKPHSSYSLKIDDPRLRRGIRLSCIADFSSVIDLIEAVTEDARNFRSPGYAPIGARETTLTSGRDECERCPNSEGQCDS